MPVDALIAHLGMLVQELVGQGQRAGIILQIGEDLGLALRLIGPAQLAINQHQVVMRADVLRIDGQNPVVKFERALVIALDLAKFAELLQRNSIPRKRYQHLFEVSLGLIELTALYEYAGLLKE